MLIDRVTHLHAYRNLAHGHTQIALIWATLKAKPADHAQAQNGGYRMSSGAQRKLQPVTGEHRLLAPDRRLCVPGR